MIETPLSRRGVLSGAAGLIVLGGVAACSKTENTSTAPSGGTGSLLDSMKKRGYANLGVANELPYSFAGADGRVQGVEPEVAQAVLKRLGVEQVKGVVGSFASMIPSLQAGQMDMICAALFMKESRCATILFSEPDAVSNDSLAVASGNPLHLGSIKDIVASPSARLSVVGGTLESSMAESNGVPKSRTLVVQDNKAGVEALTAGRTDAYLGPTLTIKDIAGQGGAKFDVVGPVPEIPITGAGVGFRKGDATFLAQYNEQLTAIQKSGEFATILKKYGFDPELAMKTSAAELCKTKG